MNEKILVVGLPLHGVSDAGEATSLLARLLRGANRSLGNGNLVQFPWLNGSRGTLDFLVTHTLGSFLEVEVTSASGEEIVVPIGLAGEDGKLAVIEMARVASVAAPGNYGTTAGIGELIQDALDEGAFSILLCQEEPLAFDAGFGAASALGVRFFDATDTEMDLSKPGAQLSRIHRVDTSARSFALLSSRIFVARATNAFPAGVAPETMEELRRLAEIIQRDTSVPVTIDIPSVSAVEFGLTALLGAEIRDGAEATLEASHLREAIERGEFSAAIILAPSLEELDAGPFRQFLELLRARVPRRTIIVQTNIEADAASPQDSVYSLLQAPVFQQAVRPNATADELRRDVMMRLEALLPGILAAWDPPPAISSKRSRRV